MAPKVAIRVPTPKPKASMVPPIATSTHGLAPRALAFFTPRIAD